MKEETCDKLISSEARHAPCTLLHVSLLYVYGTRVCFV